MAPNSSGVESRPLRLHIELELLIVRDRTGSDATGRCLNILSLDGLDDIGWRKAEADQPVRVEPDPHRVIEAAQDGGLPHAGCA